MRCSEARQRLIESRGAVSDAAEGRELRSHLATCHDCALFARAERALSGDFEIATADDDTDKITLSALKARVETMAEKKTIRNRIMSQIEDQLNTRPRLLAGAGFALAALLFVTLVPFSATHTVGYSVSLAGVDPESRISPNLLTAAISSIGYEDISVSVSSTDTSRDYTIANLPSEYEARGIASAVATVIAYEGVPVVRPVVEIREEPLSVMVAGVVKRIEVEPVRVSFDDGRIVIDKEDVSGSIQSPDMSDEEVETKIRELLSDIGVSDSGNCVKSVTDLTSKTRTVTIQIVDSMNVLTDRNGEICCMDVFVTRNATGAEYRDEDVRFDLTHRIAIEFTGDKKDKGPTVRFRVKLKED